MCLTGIKHLTGVETAADVTTARSLLDHSANRHSHKKLLRESEWHVGNDFSVDPGWSFVLVFGLFVQVLKTLTTHRGLAPSAKERELSGDCAIVVPITWPHASPP